MIETESSAGSRPSNRSKRYDLSDFLSVSASSASVTTHNITNNAQSATNLASRSDSTNELNGIWAVTEASVSKSDVTRIGPVRVGRRANRPSARFTTAVENAW